MKYLQKLENWIIILAGIVLLILSLAAILYGNSTSLAQQRIPLQDYIFFLIAAALGGLYITFRRYLRKYRSLIIILAGIVLLILSLAAIPDGISTSLALQRIPPQNDKYFWIAAALGGLYITSRRYLRKYRSLIIIPAGIMLLISSSYAAIPDGSSILEALQRILPQDYIFFLIAAALGGFYITFRRYLRKYRSLIIILAGIALLINNALITIFLKTTLGLFAIDAGILGFCYIVGVLYLLFFNRIKFDQLLVSGDFLTKVTRLVLFFPFALTFFSLFVLNSPKDLTYYNESSKQSSEFNSNDKSTLEQQEPNMLLSLIKRKYKTTLYIIK